MQFWLDGHVANAQPDLTERLSAFAAAYPEDIAQAGEVRLVPGGEAIKNDIHLLEGMLKVFEAANLDRRSYVVVVGGGAVLDAVGFAAAIAHRGLRLVRLHGRSGAPDRAALEASPAWVQAREMLARTAVAPPLTLDPGSPA